MSFQPKRSKMPAAFTVVAETAVYPSVHGLISCLPEPILCQYPDLYKVP